MNDSEEIQCPQQVPRWMHEHTLKRSGGQFHHTLLTIMLQSMCGVHGIILSVRSKWKDNVQSSSINLPCSILQVKARSTMETTRLTNSQIGFAFLHFKRTYTQIKKTKKSLSVDAREERRRKIF